MRTSCVKNSLAVGVILLFIGVAVQPSIAIVQPEEIDVEYFDVTTELIGLGKEHTVQLTKQQIDELDSLFESIRERLNNTEIKEENVQIFNGAIVELDRLDLLGGCNIEQVQKLVTGRLQKPIFNHVIERLSERIPVDNNTNTFCQIAGQTTNTYILPPSSMMFNRLIFLIPIFYFFSFPLIVFNIFRMEISEKIPITLGNGIGLGLYESMGYRHYPAKGWIHTSGLFGNKKWDGDLYGQISKFGLFIYPDYVYIGVTGFTGINIIKDSWDNCIYYLGFANNVNIGYERPS